MGVGFVLVRGGLWVRRVRAAVEGLLGGEMSRGKVRWV